MYFKIYCIWYLYNVHITYFLAVLLSVIKNICRMAEVMTRSWGAAVQNLDSLSLKIALEVCVCWVVVRWAQKYIKKLSYYVWNFTLYLVNLSLYAIYSILLLNFFKKPLLSFSLALLSTFFYLIIFRSCYKKQWWLMHPKKGFLFDICVCSKT